MLLLGIVLAGVLSVSVWAAAQVWSRYPCKPWVTVVQKSPTRVSQSYMTEIGKFIIGWLVFIWVVLVLFGRCIDGLRSGFARTLMLVQMIDLYLDPFSTPR